MAISKDKIKQQFGQAVQEALEPGEQVRAQTLALSGASPWLLGGLLGMFSGQRNYFIAVTDRRVLFIKGSVSTGRPQGVAWADPIGSAALSGVDMDNSIWSRFRYRTATGKEMRFNVHRLWRDDGKAVVAAIAARPAEHSESDSFRA